MASTNADLPISDEFVAEFRQLVAETSMDEDRDELLSKIVLSADRLALRLTTPNPGTASSLYFVVGPDDRTYVQVGEDAEVSHVIDLDDLPDAAQIALDLWTNTSAVPF